MRTDPINVDKARELLRQLYRFERYTRRWGVQPRLFICKSPWECLIKGPTILSNVERATTRGQREAIGWNARKNRRHMEVFYRATNHPQVPIWDLRIRNIRAHIVAAVGVPHGLFGNMLGHQYQELLWQVHNNEFGEDTRLLIELDNVMHVWWGFDDCVIASQNPVRVENRGTSSYMVEYGDGWKYHVVNDRWVPEFIWTGKVTLEDIGKLRNQEHIAEALRIYGLERYINDADLLPMNQDKYGKLYRLPMARGSVVLVKNSTPEPDGSIKNYVLHGRGNARTAHEAVASTFGMEAIDYNPVLES